MKYSRPGLTQKHPCEVWIYVTLTRPDQWHTVFMLALVICHFFYLVVYVYYKSFQIYQNLAPDHQNYPNQEKTTSFLTQPISWIPNRIVPWIMQYLAQWPEFFRVARLGPGIPSGRECPACVYVSQGFSMTKNVIQENSADTKKGRSIS